VCSIIKQRWITLELKLKDIEINVTITYEAEERERRGRKSGTDENGGEEGVGGKRDAAQRTNHSASRLPSGPITALAVSYAVVLI